MQQAPKLQYRKKQPAQCDFCSTTIRCDMYRHVARCHLDLAQLWRCPVAWCTVWKGVQQDLMDHVRGAHRVPEEVQSVKLEKLIPPWTVTRTVYTESLIFRYSGISNDILLFSDIVLSLEHHYRVHKKGVPTSHSPRTICPSYALCCPCPRLSLPKGDRRSLVVRQWSIRRRLWAVILDRPDVRSLAHTYPGQGDTHTSRTSPDRARPAGCGGSYGVRLPPPSAAGGDGCEWYRTIGDTFHDEGQHGLIFTSRT